MNAANVTVMRRSTYLWIGAGLIMALNLFAAYARSEAVIYGALLATGLFAFVGIAFGIWAARTVTRAAAPD